MGRVGISLHDPGKVGREGGLPVKEFALLARHKIKLGGREEGYLRRNSPSSLLSKMGWRGEVYPRRNSPSSPLSIRPLRPWQNEAKREGYLRRNSPSSPLSKMGGRGELPEEEFALFATVNNEGKGEGYLRRNSPSSPLSKMGGRGRVT
jgi:hypothetical protein